MKAFENVIGLIDNFLWTYILIFILIGCAVYFTIRMRFAQFRMIGEMFRLLTHPEKKPKDGTKHISSFQAFVMALASRIGTGNLAGVATAISVGGPGSVFWMWVMALFGSSLAFVESTLAQLYKRKTQTGFIGGPAYYMKYGLKKGWLGVVFAILMLITFCYAYSMVQSNTICAAWEKAFGISPWIMGVILAVLSLVIAFGGIQRVAKVSSVIVPSMAVIYLLLAVGILIWNITLLPRVIVNIVENACGFHQVAGGALGMTIIQGIRRGLFSNEAGEGSAPNAAATATVSHPVKQGFIQALGVFTDTLVICSCTAFIILVSGTDYSVNTGIQITQDAISSQIGSIGNPLMALLLWMFAYSTIIGHICYGEINVRYLTKRPGALTAFRVSIGIIVLLGAILSLDIVWSLADITMAMITACNLLAITPLSGQAFFLLKDYIRQKRENGNPVFNKKQLPLIEDRLDAW